MGNGGCGQFITRSLCHSFLLRGMTPHTLPLLQREVPPMGDSSPRTAPAWVLPAGCSPSGTECSSVGPPRGHKFCQQACSSMGSSLHGFTGLARSLLQHGLAMGSQLPSGIHLLQCGIRSMGCRWMSAPPWTFMDCRGTTCLTMVFITSCREKSLRWCLEHLLPLLLHWSWCLQSCFLSHCLTALSQLLSHSRFFSCLTMLLQRPYYRH